MNWYFNFMYVTHMIHSKEQDLVQTLSCLSMIITPAFAEVSASSVVFSACVKWYSSEML